MTELEAEGVFHAILSVADGLGNMDSGNMWCGAVAGELSKRPDLKQIDWRAAHRRALEKLEKKRKS